MTPPIRFLAALCGLLPAACCLAARPAAAEEPGRTILINPFFNLRTDWNSNAQGSADTGNLVFRSLLGSSLRFDFPGGTGILGHYHGQLLVTRDGLYNTSVHTGTLIISYRAPLGGFIDTVLPYGGLQVQYRQPTGPLAGPSRFDSLFLAGLGWQHAPTRSALLYMGAQFDYFVPRDNTQQNYGPSAFVGYRQVLGSTALVGVSGRALLRMANASGRPERWRSDLTFELSYFPWPWLLLNPSAGLQYSSNGDFLTWTAGVSVSTNLWFVRSTPPAEQSPSPTVAIEYRNDLRQILLDTSIVPPSLGLPGDPVLP